MPADIRWLPLADVAPGTRLACELTDSDGEVLLTAGTRLDALLMATLARHDVATVPIAVEVDAKDDARAAEREAEIRAALEKSVAATNPASLALRETLLAYRLQGRKG